MQIWPNVESHDHEKRHYSYGMQVYSNLITRRKLFNQTKIADKTMHYSLELYTHTWSCKIRALYWIKFARKKKLKFYTYTEKTWSSILMLNWEEWGETRYYV